jgi:hypothetical protein
VLLDAVSSIGRTRTTGLRSVAFGTGATGPVRGRKSFMTHHF